MLQDHQLDKNIKKVLAVTFCVNTTIEEGVNETVNANEKNKEIINVEEFSNKFSDHSFSTLLQQIIHKPIGDGEGKTDNTKGKLLEKLFDKTYKDNNIVKDLMDTKTRDLRKLPTMLIKKSIVLSMEDLKIGNERLYVKNRMYVLENKALQLYLLQQHHDPPIHGHPGYKAMYQKIQANYFWFEMAKHYKQYTLNCLTCRHTKAYTVQKQGLFNLLPIPTRSG